jgi:DUF2075 family protein
MAAFYRAKLSEFLEDGEAHILGKLLASYQHEELQKRQRKAWEKEIRLLKSTVTELFKVVPSACEWSLLLEYPIPRRAKRLDAVLIAGDVIICLEFKTEDKAHSLQAQRQVEEYALDLRDFHERSHGKPIFPIAVVPKAPSMNQAIEPLSVDAVRPVVLSNAQDLHRVLRAAFDSAHDPKGEPINALEWDSSPYRPVPTIIEAAETLYAGHNVQEIAHSHAGAVNLTTTSDKLIEVIRSAQQSKSKVICFVTGVPGAGKTLAGLKLVHDRSVREEGRPAGVFLSGNGPLVKIVSAAIARDHKRRLKVRGGDRTVGTFIQNVHTFVRESMEKADRPPVEKIVVFDEAQRAWNADQNRKKGVSELSEPEIMFSIMDRHRDWAVLVALVGGGQEIHNGEGGLAEWGITLREKFKHWKVVVSPKALSSDASLAGHRLFEDGDIDGLHVTTEPAMHLGVNLRSFRAQHVTEWIDAVLAGEEKKASELVPQLRGFPIALTRSLEVARNWLHKQTRGQRRCGLVASSGAIRLRADGLELSSGFRQGNRDIYVHWFLNQAPDVRSSNQLEVAASEFECQGLELDWVGLCWGGDFAFNPIAKEWDYRDFSGSRWGKVAREIDRKYLLNSYRVLMSRARRGLIVWVPSGEESDATRLPDAFNGTADYLQRCGLTLI